MADGFVTVQIPFPGVKLKVESECRGSVCVVATTEFGIKLEAYPAFFTDNCLCETWRFIHKCLLCRLKNTVHRKMKMLSSYTHPCVITNLYDLLSFMENKVFST